MADDQEKAIPFIDLRGPAAAGLVVPQTMIRASAMPSAEAKNEVRGSLDWQMRGSDRDFEFSFTEAERLYERDSEGRLSATTDIASG